MRRLALTAFILPLLQTPALKCRDIATNVALTSFFNGFTTAADEQFRQQLGLEP